MAESTSRRNNKDRGYRKESANCRKRKRAGRYEKLDAVHLPPIAKFLIWLILSHHRLPSMDKAGWVNVEKKVSTVYSPV